MVQHLWPERLAILRAPGCRAFPLYRSARPRNVRVLAWTVDERGEM